MEQGKRMRERERERERDIEKKRYYSGLQIFFF